MAGRPPLPPGPYLVVGLARSGCAVARVLAAHGRVVAVDAGAPPEAEALAGVEVHLERDGLELLDGIRTVVKSPGVPQQSPVIAAARGRGLELVGELEIAWRLLPNEFVGVTGTNGKTTTVELLGAIHRAAGVPVSVAGNVGTPLSSLVGEIDPDAVVVAEASSFQLEDASRFAPECGVLLNLEPDHLDRHGTMEAYRAAKLRLFAHQRPDAVAVTPHGFGPHPGEATRVTFGAVGGADLELRAGVLSWRGERLLAADEIRLRGAHNVENAMAAAAAALARGIPADAVRAALATFAGVRHRLEDVGEREGVLYVNDSKATNVASTRVALAAFAGGVHLILGGRAKGAGFGDLRDLVAERCRAVYLIGEAAGRAAQELDGAAPLVAAGTLEAAVARARAAARAGEVVLLSPACASQDQFRDFEQRGDRFAALVRG